VYTNCMDAVATIATPAADAGTISSSNSCVDVNVTDGLNYFAQIQAPATLTVGAVGQTIPFWFYNTDDRTLVDICTPIVLPKGVKWDGTQIGAMSPSSGILGTAPVPTISSLGTTAGGGEIVNVCYDQAPPLLQSRQRVDYT
ncbi:hypothetical protein D7Y13_43590, partial [Corallococcus praedator]